ncbi:MAG: formate/nitrite transporter family protein [Lachnospiraceae bacterium]
MTHLKSTILKAILAGFMISLGAMAYLGVEDHTVGAFLFTIGLFTIYTMDLYLYTGKVGYMVQNKNYLQVVFIWLGNFVGASFGALLVANCRMTTTTNIMEHVEAYAITKTTDGYLSIFILGILCGVMMFLAAESYKLTHDTVNSVGGYVGLFLCVMLFLLLGFEHSIANMFYFTLAGAWSVKAVIALLIVTLGNAVGGLGFNTILYFIRKEAH